MYLIVSGWGALCLFLAGFSFGQGVFDNSADAVPPVIIAGLVVLNIWSVFYAQIKHPPRGTYRKDEGAYFWKFHPHPKDHE